MVPQAVVVLGSLPLGPSGKVDHRALPAPEREGVEGGLSRARTPLEEGLAEVFGRVLGVAAVGAEDDFFALGGHSLLATRVMSQVRRTFAVELPLRALFESPTVRGLAERIENERGAGGRVVPPLVRVPRGEGLALSFGQQRLWFLDQLDEGGAYHVARAFRLRGDLDLPSLERSLVEIATRHESLRTRFVTVDGRGEQRIEERVDLPLSRVDLGAHPEPEREARRLAGEELGRPFDLSRAPLARASLLRLGPRDHVLMVVMHHIVSDGWSMAVLIQELGELYRAHHEGRSPQLAALPVQYADHAAWQRAWLQWRGAGGADLVLARAAPRGECPPASDRPAAPSRAALRGLRGAPVAADGAADQAAGSLPERRGDALHAAAGLLPGAAFALDGTDGRQRRHSDRGRGAGTRSRASSASS